MKGEILMRTLSTGDYMIFAKTRKNLYLIDEEFVSEWQKSDQRDTTLRKMLRAGKARRFGPHMLEQLRAAISRVNFKI